MRKRGHPCKIVGDVKTSLILFELWVFASVVAPMALTSTYLIIADHELRSRHRVGRLWWLNTSTCEYHHHLLFGNSQENVVD